MKWLRKAREKYLGTFYEGPDPPERLREMVIDFANHHPRATRVEWVDFAAGIADECFRSGYVRGYDYTERTPDWRPDVPPEVLADWIDPTWKWQHGISLETPKGIPLEEQDQESDIMKRQVDEMLIATARTR